MFGFVMINLLHFCDAGLSQLCDDKITGLTFVAVYSGNDSQASC